MALQLTRRYQFHNNFYDVETTVYDINIDRNALNQDQLRQLPRAVDGPRLLLLGSIFEKAFVELQRIINDFDPHDRVQVTIDATGLRENVSNTVTRVMDFRWQTLFHQLMSVLNSNEEIDPTEGLTLMIERILARRGGAKEHGTFKKLRKHDLNATYQEIVKRNTSLESPPDTLADFLCGPASLIIGLDRQNGVTTPLRRMFDTRQKRKDFNQRCFDICRPAGTPNYTYRRNGLSIDEMKDIIELNPCFEDYAICILDFELGNAVVYKHNEAGKKHIELLLYQGHYMYIKSMPGFLGMGTGIWCPVCERVYNGRYQHNCLRRICAFCKCINECQGDMIKCDSCLRSFKGQECFDNHLIEGASEMTGYKTKIICEAVMACIYCGKDLKAHGGVREIKNGAFRNAYKNSGHDEPICFYSKCHTCGEKYDSRKTNHKCYVKRITSYNL